MKKSVFVLTVLFALVFTSNGFAQNERRAKLSPEERSKKQTEFMKKNLNLTDEQAVKVEALNLKQMKEAEKERKTNRDQMLEKRKERDNELKTILTEEQFKSYEANREKRKKENFSFEKNDGKGKGRKNGKAKKVN